LTHYGCHSSGKLFWDKILRAGEKICKDKKENIIIREEKHAR